MGRGRGKGRKFIDNSNDDNGSGEEEKIPVQKRRGRPQKPLKDDIDDEVAAKIMEDEDMNSSLTNKDKTRSVMESGKKRKKKEKTQLLEDENETEVKSSFMESTPTKSNGRATSGGTGNRRKGKPCRAAEACVECS